MRRTLVDYHVHLLGHFEVEDPASRLADFLKTAIGRGVEQIGFADHDRYVDIVDLPALSRVGKANSRVQVRAGLEFDYIPGREDEVRTILSTLDLDYLMGSVHSIEGWGIDEADQAHVWEERDVDEVYMQYYGLLARAASTGLFDIIGHLDLPKVFGYRPKKNAASYAAPALRAIKDSGCAVEVNTNGRYKPAGEMYPTLELLEKCFEMDIPVTLGSDAHAPENAGRDVALAAGFARRAGYKNLATFSGHRRVMQAI